MEVFDQNRQCRISCTILDIGYLKKSIFLKVVQYEPNTDTNTDTNTDIITILVGLAYIL